VGAIHLTIQWLSEGNMLNKSMKINELMRFIYLLMNMIYTLACCGLNVVFHYHMLATKFICITIFM
jgi:hypothetical protein